MTQKQNYLFNNVSNPTDHNYVYRLPGAGHPDERTREHERGSRRGPHHLLLVRGRV